MRIDIDLVSPHYEQGKKLRKILLFCLCVISAVLLLNVYNYIKTRGELEHYRKRTEQLSRRVPVGKVTGREFVVDPAERKKVESRIGSLNQIIYQDAFPWTGVLHELEEIMPEGAFLSAFEADFRKREVHITGETKSASDVIAFLKNLQKSRYLQSCFLTSQKTDEGKALVIFELKGQLRHIPPEVSVQP